MMSNTTQATVPLLLSSTVGANARADDPGASVPRRWRCPRRFSTPVRRRLLAMFALGFLALPACADEADARGSLVSADPIADLDLDVEQIRQYLAEFGLDPAAAQYAVKT